MDHKIWPIINNGRGNETISNDGYLGNEWCLFSPNGYFYLKCQCI